MTKEVKNWLDSFFMGEEVTPFASITDAAANMQFWREDGVEVPAGLTAHDLFLYCAGKAKVQEDELNTYKIGVTYHLQTYYYVEARNADEADAIFEAWGELHDAEIMEDLLEDSQGYMFGRAYIQRPGTHIPETARIDWEVGKKLLDGMES